jgi:hypothetical protein
MRAVEFVGEELQLLDRGLVVGFGPRCWVGQRELAAGLVPLTRIVQ